MFLKRPNAASRAIASLIASMLLVGPAAALPSGWQVETGDVTFDVVGGNTLNVTSSQANAVVNWQQFNIAQGETVNFFLPNNLASILNRVFGGASTINGALNSNGTVILSNPAGISFGNAAQVNVGALIASTLNLSTPDYLAQNWTFARPDGLAPGLIDNLGDITALPGGFVVLAGGAIKNSGNIYAPEGQITLAAGDVIRMQVSDAQAVEVTIDEGLKAQIDTLQAAIDNHGTLTARDIRLKAKLIEALYAKTINHTGRIVATTAVTGESGVISLRAEGPDASIVVENTGELRANADLTGNGGTITLLADGHTQFDGLAEAKGGSESGDGGFIETSGTQTLRIGETARIDASAAHGTGGLWLMDPTDMTIHAGAGANDASNVYANNIQTTLNTGTSVTVQTAAAGGAAGDLTVSQGVNINKTTGGDATLTLQAHNSILFNGANGNAINITSTSGKLHVVLNSDTDQATDGGTGGAIALNYASITSNGGDITLGGGANPLTTATLGTTANNDGIVMSNGSILDSGAGAMSLRGKGRDIGGSSTLTGIYMDSASQIVSTTGDIYLAGTGGNGVSDNWGVAILNAARVQTQDGLITIDAAAGDGTGDANRGLNIYNSSWVRATGLGDILITATGGNGVSFNQGIAIWSGSDVTTQNGAITITATASASTTGNGNVGLTLEGGSVIASQGGAVMLIGVGGGGANVNHGLYIENNSSIYTTSGDITLQGQTADPDGVELYSSAGLNTLGTNTMTGNITIMADTFSLANLTIRNNGGTINFAPRTTGASIGLNGGAGAVQFTNAMLNTIDTNIAQPARVTLGDASNGSGLVTIANNWAVNGYNFDIEAVGGSVSAGAVTSGANNFNLTARTGDVTLGGNLSAAEVNLHAAGSILDGNGVAANITTTGNASLTAGNLIGNVSDPLDVAITGALTSRASGSTNGFSAVLAGSVGSIEGMRPVVRARFGSPDKDLLAAAMNRIPRGFAGNAQFNGLTLNPVAEAPPVDLGYLQRDKFGPSIGERMLERILPRVPQPPERDFGPVIQFVMALPGQTPLRESGGESSAGEVSSMPGGR